MTDWPEAAGGAEAMAAVLAAEAAGEFGDHLAFWGHTPPAHGGVGPHVLSQWYGSRFTIDGIEYPSAEHAMMAAKAELFGDEPSRRAILAAATPAEAKALGRGVVGFDDAIWSAERFSSKEFGTQMRPSLRSDSDISVSFDWNSSDDGMQVGWICV